MEHDGIEGRLYQHDETTPLRLQPLSNGGGTSEGGRLPRASRGSHEEVNDRLSNKIVLWFVVGALCYLIVLCHVLLGRVQDTSGLPVLMQKQNFPIESQAKALKTNHQGDEKSKKHDNRKGSKESSPVAGDSNPVRILIVFGPSEDPWQELMAEAIQDGCQSVPFNTHVQVKTVSNATFEDFMAADAILLGSSVENANTHPAVQRWIDEHWDIEQFDDRHAMKVGAAFVTAGGISAGQEGALHNLLKTMLVFRMMVVGGETWETSFGVAAITGEAPFMQYPYDDGGAANSGLLAAPDFPKACYLKPGELISPMFLKQAKGLGSRAAKIARRLVTGS